MTQPYYQDEWVTIYNADCRDVLPTLDTVDLVLTDPPFSAVTHANAKSNRGRGHGNKAIDFDAIDFDAIDFDAISKIISQCGQICDGWFVSFLDWRHIYKLEENTPTPWEFMRFGVWVKTNPMPQISSDRPANGWDGIVYMRHAERRPPWNGGSVAGNYVSAVVSNGLHPTQKPPPFVKKLILWFSDSGNTVLDPFMGSGTTLRAAKDLNRKAIGIEIEERYCEIAANRMSQLVMEL